MRALTLMILVLLIGCSSAKKIEFAQLPKTVEEAVTSPYRTAENLARDQYRHPVDTLNFFGLHPGMTVVEISPGSGWYLEILAPLMTAGGGRYIAALPKSEGSDYMAKLNAQVEAWLAAHPNVKAEVTSMTGDIAPPESADLVLTFRNIHNWMKAGTVQATFDSFFKALKPGGVLGIVEHRANEKSKFDTTAASGYVREADVIKFAKQSGFELVSKSEINANPKDTKDYPEGVWTLPPVLRRKEMDRDKYLAIGESDRMTLKFVKPNNNQ